jgi:hypothetical protein
MPNTLTVGNTAIVGFGSVASGVTIASVTDDKGNSYTGVVPGGFNGSGTPDGGGIYYSKIAIAGATVITITTTAGGTVTNPSVYVDEYVGLAGTLDKKVTTENDSTGTTFTAGPTPTTTSVSELIYHTVMYADTSVTYGDDLDPNYSGRSINWSWTIVEDERTTAKAAFSATVNVNVSSSAAIGMIATFPASPSGATPDPGPVPMISADW